MKASPGIYSFAGGELSPLLAGRQDLAKYPTGCLALRNFLPLVQGPARLRGGTGFITKVKDSTKVTQLFTFKVKETDAAIIEFGDEYNRFFKDRATINVSGAPAWSSVTTYGIGEFVTYDDVQYMSLAGGNLDFIPEISPAWWVAQDVYEIASPYAAADLLNADGSFDISIVQSIDVMYLANDGYQTRKLARFAVTDWRYSVYNPDDGPFDPQNIDRTISVTVNAETGDTTLTNDSAGVPVAEGTEGRLIRIEETDKSAVKPWEGYKRIAGEGENPEGQERRSDGKFYECTTDAVVGVGEVEFRTGTVRPTHTEGIFSDGDGEPLYSGTTLFAKRVGVAWEYKHAGYGVARITEVEAGGAEADITILSRMPDSNVSPGSYRWSLGGWYEGHYPSSLAFMRDRLGLATVNRGNLSVAGSYESHAPDEFNEVLPDSAIDVQITVGQGDGVLWMKEIDDGLLIGTAGGEHLLREITRNQVFGPANCTVRQVGENGSRRIPPINVNGFQLITQAGGRRELEAQYDASIEELVVADLTAFAEHVTESGIIWKAYAKNPNSTIYYGLSNGKVAALTYRKDQTVMAWSLHDFGGYAESGAVIPSPTPGIDDLYLVMRRTVDDETVRYIEVMLPPHTAPNDPFLSCYQDCSLTYDGAQAVNLLLAAEAVTKGAEDVVFTAGGPIFTVDSIGREILQRVYRPRAKPVNRWTSARAIITGYVSPTVVQCTILSAFPAATTLAAGDWRLSANEMTGLDHLNGETVRVTVDGATHPDCVVDDGAITLLREGCIVHAGLAMDGYVQPMFLEAGGDDGTSQAKNKKFSTMVFRMFESGGFKYGSTLDSRMIGWEYRRPSHPMDEALPLFTGDASVTWPGGYETNGDITLLADLGLPCTLVAIYPQVHVESSKVSVQR